MTWKWQKKLGEKTGKLPTARSSWFRLVLNSIRNSHPRIQQEVNYGFEN